MKMSHSPDESAGSGIVPALARPRTALVIRNPVAGRRKLLRFQRAVTAMREAGLVTTVVETGRAGDAIVLAREAAADIGVVVAAGGDGTINEVVTGLQQRAAEVPSPGVIPLGVIPLGTANVFALELGIPLDPAAAGRVVAGDARRHVWPGLVDGRAVIQMVGVGFDARVVDAVTAPFKARWGKLAYVFQSLRLWWRFPADRFTVRLPDGRTFTAGTVIATKGRLYAGRFLLAPSADPGAAGFTLCLFPRATRWNALKAMAALPIGLLPRLGGLRMLPVTEAEIDCDGGSVPAQIDGDRGGTCPVSIRPGPCAIEVMVAGPG
ncbi:MAG: diacylglycerol kinase family protein [Azospirillaceae bacterium]